MALQKSPDEREDGEMMTSFPEEGLTLAVLFVAVVLTVVLSVADVRMRNALVRRVTREVVGRTGSCVPHYKHHSLGQVTKGQDKYRSDREGKVKFWEPSSWP